MIKISLDFLNFINSNFPFLLALVLYTILAISLSKSIKKHSKIYYWVFGVLGVAFAVAPISRVFGISVPFSISSIPLIGTSAGELSDAAYFIHPVLVIIMYMGALSAKNRYVPRLMSIRKELSIIVGFPLIAHLAKRLFHTFPDAWSYFINYSESIESPKIVSTLAANIQNGVFVLGVVMTLLFIVLWVTSFDSVHRKLGAKRWKSIQRWSYALYAMLFIHAVGLQLSRAIDYNAKMHLETQTTIVTSQESVQPQNSGKNGHGQQQAVVQKQAGHSHGAKGFSFSTVKLSTPCKATINIVIYILIYGSYLILRIRKARRLRAKKSAAFLE